VPGDNGQEPSISSIGNWAILAGGTRGRVFGGYPSAEMHQKIRQFRLLDFAENQFASFRRRTSRDRRNPIMRTPAKLKLGYYRWPWPKRSGFAISFSCPTNRQVFSILCGNGAALHAVSEERR